MLCLGDSITAGIPADGGYRKFLFAALPENYVAIGSHGHGNFEKNRHEGHPGFMIKDLRGREGIFERLRGWHQEEADIVLLHIGTNTLAANYYLYPNAAEMAYQELNEVIVELRNLNPKAKIIVAKIIGIDETKNEWDATQQKMLQDAITQFNALIDGIPVNHENTVVADMKEAALTPSDYQDMAHPNATGYEKMAKVWLNAIL